MTLIPYRPEAPFIQRLAWRTDVMESRDGNEQRIALRTYPRQSFDVRYLVEEGRESQMFWGLFARNTAGTHLLPVWSEAVYLPAATPAGTTVLLGDFSQFDSGIGPDVLILSPDGDTYETQEKSAQTDADITLLVGTVNSYPAGSVVVPCEEVYVEGRGALHRHNKNAVEVRTTLVAKTPKDIEARGAAALTEYAATPVLDRRHTSPGLVEEEHRINLGWLDYGNTIEPYRDFLASKVRTPRNFVIASRDDRQWWKLFLATVAGRQGQFYAPTWRDDLSVALQPGASNTVEVWEEPNYFTHWNVSPAHKAIQLETDAGTLYRTVTNVSTVATTAGAQTLTLDLALPATTVRRISHLELARLASDEVRIEHREGWSQLVLAIETVRD